MYATGVGLVIKGLNGFETTKEETNKQEQQNIDTNIQKSNGLLSKLLEKGKSWLNDGDDIKDF